MVRPSPQAGWTLGMAAAVPVGSSGAVAVPPGRRAQQGLEGPALEASLPNIERHLHGADRLGAAIAHDDGNLGRLRHIRRSSPSSSRRRLGRLHGGRLRHLLPSSPFSSSTVTPLVQTSKWKCGMASPCNGPASMPRLRLSLHSHVKTNFRILSPPLIFRVLDLHPGRGTSRTCSGSRRASRRCLQAPSRKRDGTSPRRHRPPCAPRAAAPGRGPSPSAAPWPASGGGRSTRLVLAVDHV